MAAAITGSAIMRNQTRLLLVLGFSCLLVLAVFLACGCGGGSATTTSSSLTAAVTTASTAPAGTTSSPPSSTQEQMTTSTQFTVGVNPKFISKEKTLADVTTGTIEPGSALPKQPGVPAALTALYQTKNHGGNILYVGKANRDGEMNAVLTDKMFRYQSWPQGRGLLYDYFGAGAAGPDAGVDRNGKVIPSDMCGEFVDVILAASPQEPTTKDFYMRIRNLLTGKEAYIRVGLPASFKLADGSSHLGYTGVYLFDLQADVQTEFPQTSLNAKDVLKNFLARHKLSELLQPGDIVDVGIDGRVNQGEWDPGLDIRGVPVASWIMVERFNGDDTVRALLTGFY